MFTAQEIPWSGTTVIRLTDEAAGTTALLAPELGGNLFSLTSGGVELLRSPADADKLRGEPTRWGIPVLLPPGRITGGRFQFGGRDYQLELRAGTDYHIHGFLLKRAWQVVETSAGPDGARAVLAFRAADHPDVLAQFPHPFVFTVAYTLNGRALRCETWIQNDGAEPMPFGLGFHHYFAAPDDGSGAYELRLPGAGKQWEIVDTIPTGRFYEPQGVEDLAGWQPVHALRRDAGYMVTEPAPDGWSRAELANRATGDLLTVSASPEYKHWVIFNGRPGFEGFICLEPYTAMANAFNLPIPPELSGMSAVAPGVRQPAGTWVVEWSHGNA